MSIKMEGVRVMRWLPWWSAAACSSSWVADVKTALTTDNKTLWDWADPAEPLTLWLFRNKPPASLLQACDESLNQHTYTSLYSTLFYNIYSVYASVLWHCWLDGRKGIQPVKTWVMRCCHGYLSGAKCKWLAYGPADATATPSSLLQKIQNGYPSGTGLPR